MKKWGLEVFSSTKINLCLFLSFWRSFQVWWAFLQMSNPGLENSFQAELEEKMKILGIFNEVNIKEELWGVVFRLLTFLIVMTWVLGNIILTQKMILLSYLTFDSEQGTSAGLPQVVELLKLRDVPSKTWIKDPPERGRKNHKISRKCHFAKKDFALRSPGEMAPPAAWPNPTWRPRLRFPEQVGRLWDEMLRS